MDANQKLLDKPIKNEVVFKESISILVYTVLLIFYSVYAYYANFNMYENEYDEDSFWFQSYNIRIYPYLITGALGLHFEEKKFRKLTCIFIVLSIILTMAQLGQDLSEIIIAIYAWTLGYFYFSSVPLFLIDTLVLAVFVHVGYAYRLKLKL